MRVLERLPVQSIQRKENVTRDDELRVAIPARRVSRERVVAREMRVDNFNLVLPHEPRQLIRASYVERVAQRQRFDPRWRQIQLRNERRTRADGDVQLVAAIVKSVREIGDVTLAAGEGRR